MVREAEANKEADMKRKGDIEIKNKAQSYVDQINQTLTEQGDKLTPEQKDQLTKLRDEASGAIEANDINKLREIVGKLEDAAAQAGAYQSQAGASAGANANNAGASSEGNETADDVVDADFTDSKK